MKRKYYLIDSENVGDRWFDLLQKIGKKDQVITFYTENHSNRLKEYLLTQVHNPRILWLECATGNNALDYQLIGVLAYLIAKHPKASFCVYSNDKDYQNTVDFWQSRGINVCQKGFVEANKKKDKKKKEKNKQKIGKSKQAEWEQKHKAGKNKQPEGQQRTGKDKQPGKVQKEGMKLQSPRKIISPAPGGVQIPRRGKLTEEQYVKEIAKSVPLSDLGSWYQTLTAFLGQEKGRDWYLRIKDDAELRDTLSRYYMADEHFRGVNLVAAVLNLHELDVTRAEEAYKIIQSHSRKNLKAIRADFEKKFGKKPEQKYFKVLRPIIQVIKGKGFQR